MRHRRIACVIVPMAFIVRPLPSEHHPPALRRHAMCSWIRDERKC
jgi:hypothetical protein